MGFAQCRRSAALAAGLALVTFVASAPAARASDHDDTPLLREIGRHDARITDFYAFVREGRLVLVVTTNPAIPVGVGEYAFPDDLTVSFYVDANAQVGFDDPAALATYGGTVRKPERIKEDVVFEVTFAGGAPHLETRGLPSHARRSVRLFAGLRDDPFIRGPRIGRNVGAVVIDVPLPAVLRGNHALLLWAGTHVPEVDGPIADLGARSLRSQFAENLALNDFHPSRHQSELGLPPDVIFLDPTRPVAFPNGRELADDVVDLVGDPRILATDAPFPSENDLPFLTEFPFLSPPHLP